MAKPRKQKKQPPVKHHLHTTQRTTNTTSSAAVADPARGSSLEDTPMSPMKCLILAAKQIRNEVLQAARKYLEDVKTAGKYGPFAELLFEHKLDIDGLHWSIVITRMEKIFEDRPDLLAEFNTFLPEGFQCAVPAEWSTNEDGVHSGRRCALQLFLRQWPIPLFEGD